MADRAPDVAIDEAAVVVFDDDAAAATSEDEIVVDRFGSPPRFVVAWA